MKKLIAALLCLFVLTPAGGGFAWEPPAKSVAGTEADETIRDVTWEGVSDLDMLHTVRADLKSAREDKKIKTLRVLLLSPGGPVITSLEIARLVRQASDAGLIVEIHGVALIASGGTFILAAGTPGKRYIAKQTFFLVHSVQVGGGFMSAPECGVHKDDPKSVDDRMLNVLLDTMRDLYARLTGKPAAEVEKWLTCGKERIGTGQLALDLGIADRLE
jgi:ATP-dependent protease ClpP protease subunit